MLEAPQQSIEVLKALPVQITWSNQGYEGSFFTGFRKVYGEFFSIELQGQSYDELDQQGKCLEVPATFGGSIEYDQNGDKYLSVGTLLVGKDFRRNGLGERLSKARACIAVEQGCKKIEASFSHPAALKICRKIYGDDRIHFTRKDDFGEEIPLDITPEEAIEAIMQERQLVIKYGVQHGIWKHHPKTDEEILPGAVNGIDAWIDVEGFDTSGFEQPIQTGILPGSEPQDDCGMTDPFL